jgi:hypothetical protein
MGIWRTIFCGFSLRFGGRLPLIIYLSLSLSFSRMPAYIFQVNGCGYSKKDTNTRNAGSAFAAGDTVRRTTDGTVDWCWDYMPPRTTWLPAPMSTHIHMGLVLSNLESGRSGLLKSPKKRNRSASVNATGFVQE